MEITETFSTSNSGWLEYMANKIDILIVLQTIQSVIKIAQVF